MNIFLTYENDISASVQSIDDRRLNRQILECYQLLSNATKEANGEEIKGYKNHPVYVFYKQQPYFLAFYGAMCCVEYLWRFEKFHYLSWEFNWCRDLYIDKLRKDEKYEYTPYYMEGSIKDPNHIRTTENVSALFQTKLCKKWEQDKANGRSPKWTNRPVPQFYEKFLKENRK